MEPPGVRLSSAATIFSFSPTGVGGSTMPAAPAYTTIPTVSVGFRLPNNSFIDCLTSGSLSGGLMEPLTSSSITRLACGRWRAGSS